MSTHLEFFKNEPLSPLGINVPYWQWKSDILSFNEKETCRFLLQTEKELIEKYPPSSHKGVTPSNSLGARYEFFNFFKFEHETAKVLQKFIRDNIKLFFKEFPEKFDTSNLSIICWYNILRKWDRLGYHVHVPTNHIHIGESFISGNLTIACEKTSTHYYSICRKLHWQTKNVPGSLVLFPSYVPHESEVHLGPHPRIVVAFDLFFNDACGPGPLILKEGNVLPFKINES